MTNSEIEKTGLSRRHILGMAFGGTLLLASGLAGPAFAQHDDQFVLACPSPTPSMTASSYPGANKIILSNNLARPTGKSEDAPGQLLYLTGRIVDQNCTPVVNAIIDLWQPNPYGEYRWASRDELLTPYPVFAGNGRAVTDNMGRYKFTTLFPGSIGRNAPQIHLRVTHPEFKPLTTTMYFRGDGRNADDSRFKAIRGTSREMLLGDVKPRNPTDMAIGLDTVFDITLQGTHTFREY